MKKLLLRQKEIYNEVTEEKKNEIEKLYRTVNRKELIYKYRGNTADADFSNFNGAIDTINKIASKDISLSKVIDNSELGEVKTGNPKRKSSRNLEVIKNAENLYNARQAAINFIIEYTGRVSDAKSRANQEGKGLKILTPKGKLQRLPIALAQIRASNNSESLLNEIKQIVYSLYQSKEVTNKVYNNTSKSIKV